MANQAKSDKVRSLGREKSRSTGSRLINRKEAGFLNRPIVITCTILLLLGLVMVYTASSYLSMKQSPSGSTVTYFSRQLIYVVVGLVFAWLGYRLNPDWFQKPSIRKSIMIGITMLMVLVHLWGQVVNGAKGWLKLGPFSIQPIEFMKLALIILWAGYLARYQDSIAKKGFWRTIISHPGLPVLILVWLAMVVTLPDLGGAMLLMFILSVMSFASGVKPKYLIYSAGLLALAYVLFMVVFNTFDMSFLNDVSYAFRRLTSFVDPFSEQQGSGLQLINSYYALAMGGLFGRGPGKSIQKTGYLPEAHNDFIMSIVGEEFGFVMIVIILVLYGFLTFYLFYKAQQMHKPYYQLLLVGIGAYFLAQGLVNLGGVTGLLPITGVTFPFFSYGGSSMLVTCMLVGLALGTLRADQRLAENRSAREKKQALKSNPSLA